MEETLQYRRAKTWQVALTTMTGAGQMVFYILMSSATYIGNANFGILVSLTGVIITASRIFDGITDPIIAYFLERYNGKKIGKVRFSILVGWFIMSCSILLMCNLGPKLHLSGIAGIVYFVFCYFAYIIGYTFASIAGQVNANILTNDPKQRPKISVWNTIYSYLTPMALSIFSMAILLPKFNNIQGTAYFASYSYIVVIVSGIFYALACVGIAEYDVPESYASLAVNDATKDNKPSIKDMTSLIKENKELQKFIISACSDKLAQTINSASVVSTLLYGVMLGSMGLSTILTAIAMFPSIIFAIIGSKICGEKGSRYTLIRWTWICIIVNALYAFFLYFAPTDLVGGVLNGKVNTSAIIVMVLFVLFNFAISATKMVVSVATNSMRMDIVDYELDRSGRYLPATVSATYSFVDKIISSFGATIATVFVGFIGYTTYAPQQGDPLTTGVRIITIILLVGFPVIGWICTILALRTSNLTYEKMVEVQSNIAKKKAEMIENNEAK